MLMKEMAEADTSEDSGKKRRHTVSKAELYAVLDVFLPIAEAEAEFLASLVETFPEDPDHVEDVAKLRQVQEAIVAAKRLIARKTAYVDGQVRTIREGHASSAASVAKKVGEVQRHFSQFKTEGQSEVDALIAERREEAARE
jgi:hypothetical protein